MKLAWCVVNDKGTILPYTCQSSAEACIDYAEDFFPWWERMKEIGCTIREVEIKQINCIDNMLSIQELEKRFRPHGRISPKRTIKYETE